MLSTRLHGEKLLLSPAYSSCFRHLISYPALSFVNKRRYHSLNPQIVDDQVSSSDPETPDIVQPEPYSFYKQPCFDHWFKNWQHRRKHKLTASTFGAAVGLFPKRRVQLWEEKIGAIKPFSSNDATRWTNISEVEALESYKESTRNSVDFYRNFQVYQKRKNSKTDHWLGASSDGLVVESEDGKGLRGVIEIKCPYFGGDMTHAVPWKRVPLYYIPQAQGLMEILDCEWMHLYCWTTKGTSLFRLYRDVEYWAILEEALSDFWWDHVHPARELYSKSKIIKPRIELKPYVPEPRHELCATIVHRSRQLVDESDLIFRQDGPITKQPKHYWDR